MPTLLFVCTGNTGRSPMAAALLSAWLDRRGLAEAWQVWSAGLAAEEGAPPEALAREVLAERALDIAAHRARRITAELVAASQLIVCMTRAHQRALQRDFPSAAPKTMLFSAWARQAFDVPDPYGAPKSVYVALCEQLEQLIEQGGEDLLVKQKRIG